MNHDQLIQQLSQNLKPVNVQKSFAWRFSILMSACALIAIAGVYYWFLKKSEFHMIEGRSLLEGILLLFAFIASALLGTKSASPVTSNPKNSKKPALLLSLWFFVLAFSFIMGFLENATESLVALKYNTWLCPMVIMTVAIPSFFISLFYFFKGAVLYPVQAFLYSSTLAMSLGALGLSFICPWADPLHEILWHVAPVFLCVGLLTFPLNAIFAIATARLNAKTQNR